MKKEHFIDRVKNSILDYLPEEFRDAEILVREVVKVPAGKRTGLCVRKKDRVVSAVLYLEPYYEKVEEDGIPLGCVLQEIADGIIQAGLGEEQALKVADRVRDYDWVSEHLVIQMFDRDEVQETEDVIIYDFGILSGMVRVMLSDGCSVIATHALLDGEWHVTKERLLEDARKDLALETKGLWDVQSVLMHHTGRADYGNLQETNLLTHPDLEADSGLYVLMTNMGGYAAHLAMDNETLSRVADRIGGSYFLLPSSIHELMVCPDNGAINPQELKQMVVEINATQVSAAEKLSDKVFYFSQESGKLSVCA